jgi:3-hydroxyisobutyrate dehydrogenase-like beta-hydroxyacid dehydrogenase
MSKVGFIGLGDMGQVLIPRLLEAGHEVIGWNRTAGKDKLLQEKGMKLATSVKDLASKSEFIISIITDAKAVESISLGNEGIISVIADDAVYLDMSTISPMVSRKIYKEFKAKGKHMCDAPISGSPVTVVQGKASVMVGGDESSFNKSKPVLESLGSKVTYIGESGLAVQTKLSINLLLMVQVIAFGEAVALAEKGGVSRESVVEAILNSVAASPVLNYRGPFILEGQMPAKPLADVTLQQKDMTLVLEQARLLGSPTPLASAANEMMNACRGLGIDKNDFVVAHQAYLKLAGL